MRNFTFLQAQWPDVHEAAGPGFTDITPLGPDRLFTTEQTDDLVAILGRAQAAAVTA
jgi:hypothetical protein